MNSFGVSEAAQRAGRLLRPARLFLGSGIAASVALAAVPSHAAPPRTIAANAVNGATAGQSITDFYTARAGQPLWLAPGNEQAAHGLLALLGSAHLDGIDNKGYRIRELRSALRAAWGGRGAARQRAELLLSEAFVAYVADLRRSPDSGVIYVDAQLGPRVPSARALLEAAAAAPSLEKHVATMGWMHPFYAPLRTALAGSRDERQRALLAVNLERARVLPAANSGRHVLVNAAAQRLYMFDRGEVQDMMRVVVGKPTQPTPMMAALIRFTTLNPYWNVPADLAAERIAPNVLKEGLPYLKAQGYQVLSGWTPDATLVDPATVDWKAVAEGRAEIRVRQLPGRANAMGDMKFMFPNRQGVYLHDTPSTELFSEAARLFSGGCVRLEAAPRLATWLYGKPLRPNGADPEQRVDLPRPIPVYLTYLTVMPSSGGQLAYFDDSYGRDAVRLAELNGAPRSGGLSASR